MPASKDMEYPDSPVGRAASEFGGYAALAVALSRLDGRPPRGRSTIRRMAVGDSEVTEAVAVAIHLLTGGSIHASEMQPWLEGVHIRRVA